MDVCYVPGINALTDNHYIAHYSVDQRFDKRQWPSVNINSFESNHFYDRVLEWMRYEKIVVADAVAHW
jgi:hypothetical protein